jgi:ABC-type branched-subunit amino acid transport system substrate-binding protein
MWNIVGKDNLRSVKANMAIVALLVGISLFISVGCNRVDPVVKIGLVGPFEGRHRDLGYDVIYSARMAVREINEAGGVGGYRVALVTLDDFGDSEMAAETAAALAADPAVVAVMGHWLPETTAAAAAVYDSARLPYIQAGDEPIGPMDPSLLPDDFKQSYADITPFDEVAGPFAATAYDTFYLLLTAIAIAADSNDDVNRETVGEALIELTYDGISGTVYQR